MSADAKNNPKAALHGPIAWMAGNSVAANLLMLVLLLGGLYYGTRIKQEVFPEFDLDRVSISVPYPGASPEEVEQGIVLALEEAIEGIEGIEEVVSQANEGRGSVTVEMIQGGNLQKLARDIESAVDGITSFPEESEDPRVNIATRQREVIILSLYGDQNDHILHQSAETIRDRLLQESAITRVDLAGTRPLEISIEIPRDTLRNYGLTLEEVARRIRLATVELPSGSLKTKGGEILVRMTERRDYGTEFARLPIVTNRDGSVVRLEEIATISDDFEETDRYARYNGKPAVMVDVYRIGNQKPLTIAGKVKELLPTLNAQLPPGMTLTVLYDRSEIYRQRLQLLLKNAYIGLALVLVLLGLFLERRLAFWVTLGIPVSFIGSLLILPLLDVSINMISMFAFIVSLGIVVDDTIVVGENIYRYRQMGHSFAEAAVLGTRGVAKPVIFAVLTNMITFMPMLFIPGIMGKIFFQIPIVVMAAFSLSLVECLLILPAHIGHQKPPTQHGLLALFDRFQGRISRLVQLLIHRVYSPFLAFSLRYRYGVIGVAIAILLITLAYYKSGRLGFTLFPRIESDFAESTVVLPYGVSVETTRAVQERLLASARAVAAKNGGDDLVKGTFSRIGSASRGLSGSHVAQVRVYLTPPQQRPIPTRDFVRKWRQTNGPVAGAESLLFRSYSGGPGSRAAMSIELRHRDMRILQLASADLARIFERYPKVKDVDDGFAPGKRQMDFTILPAGRQMGLTAQSIGRQMRNAFFGVEVLRQQRGRNEIKVKVRLPATERSSLYDLEEFMIRTPRQTDVMLAEVAQINAGRAYTSIKRRNGHRSVAVSADVTPTSAASGIVAAIIEQDLPELQKRYPGLQYGLEGRQADRVKSLKSLGNGMLVALAIIYGLLAIAFRSYIQPLIIMTSIPFGIVGAFLGHLLMGYSLSLVSMFGIVALTGVVVNDSLVLIDFANRAHADGLPSGKAILSAATIRFRPVALTTMTTFGGLAPMIFETSRQARFLVPMAISLGFGIVFATLITLLLIPALFLVVEDLHQIRRWIYGLLTRTPPTSPQSKVTPGVRGK